MEWWSMLKKEDKYKIEWSPSKGKNLRVKKSGDQEWILRNCRKAEHAVVFGYSLLEKKERREAIFISCTKELQCLKAKIANKR